MFKVNDTVVYGSQGVCSVTEITEKKIGKELKKYLVLRPVYDERNTIFVPMDNEMLCARLHPVLSEGELNRIIDELPSAELIMIENESERKERYKAILSSGNRGDVSRMIKTLRRVRREKQQAGKKLHSSDEYFLKEAEKLLYGEMATVFHIQPDQVVPLIEKRLSAVNN